MADVFDAQKRSEVMSRIRSKNTKAEVVVSRYLRKQKIYFQKHYGKVAGNPDIALPRKKKAIFIDGDFWHGKTLGQLIKRRGGENDEWVIKIKGNVERDKKRRSELVNSGWKIIRVWEDDILRKRTQQGELERIAKFLKT